jgi:hypothetical protein
MNSKELQKLIEKKYKKYNRLLWYDRIRPEWMTLAVVAELKKRIEKEFSDEVAELHSENSNWHSGFHSGCCAAFSYVLTCLDKKLGLEVADEEFPMLDT